MAVLRTHESKDFVGGIIASLSIPWGFNKGDEDLGGYHLVWPRDLVETAGALVAGEAPVDALRVLRYLESTQEADGHWAQNLWLDGRPYWGGIQMDETAFPILLLDLLRREAGDLLGDLRRWWPLVRNAASFIVRNGPVTQQDRWEEDGGYSPFTLSVEIAALLAAADVADLLGETVSAEYLRDTADTWNDNIERWTYTIDGDLARQVGVEGYYVRIAPDSDGAASPLQGFVPIKNRPPDQSSVRASAVISPDSLALVRFGLRAHDDPRILNTIKVVDALLRAKLPQGPCWYRYNGDGYGEHDDGSPFDGTGVGRPWPLLAGERAHYEISAGRPEFADASPARDGSIDRRRQPPDSRTGMGCTRYPRTRALSWQTHRIRVPAGVGALRVHQAAALAARRTRVRSTAADRTALHRRKTPLPVFLLDLQQQGAHHAVRQDAAHRAVVARDRSLEHGRLEDVSRHAHPRHWPGSVRSRFTHRQNSGVPRNRLHLSMGSGKALGRCELLGHHRVRTRTRAARETMERRASTPVAPTPTRCTPTPPPCSRRRAARPHKMRKPTQRYLPASDFSRQFPPVARCRRTLRRRSLPR